MTLLAAPALAALVLAIPLLVLHLRRRKPPRRAVGSLLAWRDLPGAGGGGARRFGRPPLPLLLLLQLLALVLLVVALAHPAKEKNATGSSHVYVVDESMWMGAEDGGGDADRSGGRRAARTARRTWRRATRCGSSAPARPRASSTKAPPRARARRSEG